MLFFSINKRESIKVGGTLIYLDASLRKSSYSSSNELHRSLDRLGILYRASVSEKN